MKLLRFWLPTLLWSAVIFLLSSSPSTKVSGHYVLNFAFFKTLHIIEYFILFLLIYRSLSNTTVTVKKNLLLLTFVLTVLYGALDELHQLFVPTREGKIRDVFIDAIGAIIAWWCLWRYLHTLPPRLKQWAETWQLH